MGFAIVTFIVAFIHVIAGAVVLHKYPQYKSIVISVIAITLRFILITTSTTLTALEVHHSTDKEKKFRLWSLT